jgi:cation transport regulator ChaC
MNPEDIDTASLDELQAEFVRLGNEVSTMDGLRRRICQRMEDLRASARAKSRIAGMSEAEVAALRRELGVQEGG